MLLYTSDVSTALLVFKVKFLTPGMSQPLWILKTAKEKHVQRLVHMSADLARQVGSMLEDIHDGIVGEVICHLFTSYSFEYLFVCSFALDGVVQNFINMRI